MPESPPLPSEARLIIFDLDGTLTDSMGLIVDTLCQAYTAHGRPAPAHEDALTLIGTDLPHTVSTLSPTLDEPEVDRIVATYCELYAGHGHARNAPLFPGARELLDRYQSGGQWMAVATGKSTRGLRRTFDAHRLDPYFLTWRTAEQSFPKPHPGMLEEILTECGLDAREAVMIGDTTYDLKMAHGLGMAAIAVTTGGLPRAHLEAENPALILESVAELDRHLPPLRG